MKFNKKLHGNFHWKSKIFIIIHVTLSVKYEKETDFANLLGVFVTRRKWFTYKCKSSLKYFTQIFHLIRRKVVQIILQTIFTYNLIVKLKEMIYTQLRILLRIAYAYFSLNYRKKKEDCPMVEAIMFQVISRSLLSNYNKLFIHRYVSFAE